MHYRNISFSCLLTLFLICLSSFPQAVLAKTVATPDKASDIVVQDSFEDSVVLQKQGDDPAEPAWKRLQTDSPTTPFKTSDAFFYEGMKSLSIAHDGVSWGSVLSRSLDKEQSGEVTIYYYDSLENPKGYVYLGVTEIDPINNPTLGKKGGISLGVNPAVSKEFYTYCPTQDLTGCLSSQVRRTKGWHALTVRVTPLGSFGLIDQNNLAILSGNKINKALNYDLKTFGRINIGINTTTDTNTYYFDLLTVKKLHDIPQSQELAYGFIQKYLNSYGTISISQVDALIKKRRADFCSVDYAWGTTGATCPTDGSVKRPQWHYKEQLFHAYDSLLITGGAHGIAYRKTGNEADLKKAKEIVAYVDGEYQQWRQQEESCDLLEKHCVTGSIVGLILGHVSWLVWDDLDTELQISITNHLMAEGNYFTQHLKPFDGYIGNSAGEENSWMASYMDRLSLIFRQRYESAAFYEKAKLLAFHSLSKGEQYGGITTQTVYPDYLFDNHNFHPHPTYGTITAFSLSSLEYLRKSITGVSTPEYWHNAENVWKKMTEFIDFRDFQYKGEKISTVQASRGDKGFKAANKNGQKVLDSRSHDLFPPDTQDTKPLRFTPFGIPLGVDEEAQRISFGASGKNDWGADAAGLTQYQLMAELYGKQSITDKTTGFSTDDVAKQALAYIYYIRSGALWKPEKDAVVFDELLMDEPTDDRNERSSYKWYENASFVWEFVSHFYYFDNVVKFTKTAVCEDNLYIKKIWSGDFQWACDDTQAIHGRKSLRLDFSDLADGEVYSPLIAVEPDSMYTIEYDYKVKEGERGTSEVFGRVIPAQFDAKATESDLINQNRVSTGFDQGIDAQIDKDGWQHVSYTFKTMPEAKAVRLRAIIGKGTGKGTFWFDGIKLQKKTDKVDGDGNGDGIIDGQDYIKWINELSIDDGQQSDHNHDGQVDKDDFEVWLRAYLP